MHVIVSIIYKKATDFKNRIFVSSIYTESL